MDDLHRLRQPVAVNGGPENGVPLQCLLPRALKRGNIQLTVPACNATDRTPISSAPGFAE